MRINTSRLATPTRLFLWLWVADIFLFSLHIMSFYKKLNWETTLFLVGVCFAFGFSGIIVYSKFRKHRRRDCIITPEIEYAIAKKTNKLLKLFIGGVILTIVYVKGFPLLWLFTGDSRTYADFGIPSLGGFINALFYISNVSYYFLYLQTHKRTYLNKVLFLFLYAVIGVNRGLLVIGSFEILGVFLFFNKIKTKVACYLSVALVSVILIFGYVGDHRSQTASIAGEYVRSLVDDEYSEIMETLPSGVTWTYLYATCSINNVVGNIQTLKPLGYPYNVLVTLVPSFVRDKVFGERSYEEKYALEMENTSFNTFTLFAPFLKDFGPFITVLLFIFFAFYLNMVYERARCNEFRFILMYPAVFMVIASSIFDNFLASLPTIAQFIITYYYFKDIKLNKQ